MKVQLDLLNNCYRIISSEVHLLMKTGNPQLSRRIPTHESITDLINHRMITS